MRHIFSTIFFVAYAVLNAQEYSLEVIAHWDNESLRGIPPLSKSQQKYNDIWGWTNEQGREFVILGSIDSIYFFDISNPYKPVLCDVEPGADINCIHRDFKTYQNYCYAVADEGNSTLQIFDLSYLPDSVQMVYDTNYLTRRTHNVFIADNYAFLASNTHVKWPFIPMTILDLNQPKNPKAIHHLKAPIVRDEPLFNHVHDVYFRDNIAYCSNGDDGLFIYDYSNISNPELLYWLDNYPEQGYNHSSWLNEEGNILVFADETHGLPLKCYDVSNPSRPKFLSTFGFNHQLGSIVHNPFIVDNFCFVSYYHEGLQVFDISNPEQPKWVAGYDTYPENDVEGTYDGYKGCWGVYPFFESGVIAASDMLNGLFLFKLNGWNKEIPVNTMFDVEIASSRENLKLLFKKPFIGEVKTSFYSLNGQLINEQLAWKAGSELNINTSFLAKGIYLLKIEANGYDNYKKVLIW
ncbi:MAG: choice-of-anchor B family protein [Bacteroidetes bacterium]|nr:choice-of-anchor B family protein [Bacteroidota bacterium]